MLFPFLFVCLGFPENLWEVKAVEGMLDELQYVPIVRGIPQWL